jgi:eukaryotic-like serine/threonine-protein kinase
MLVGTTLRSRYKIIKLLGKGGFGETYLAEDLDIPINPKPKCVVKRLQPQAISPEIVRLFQQEGEFLYKLGQKHDQIPKLSAYFEENNEFYLIQELIDGHDLSEEIIPGKQWHESDVVKLLQEILEILAFVHQQNVIHRDIKPQNLMRRRTDGKTVLIDFGAVKEVSAMQVNAQGQSSLTVGIGTPGYMPDEQASGKPKLCSDVYAVGMLGIQALTGLSPRELPEDPSTGEIIWRNLAKVSDRLANILDTMVKPHFSQRYRSAAEALQALKMVMAKPHISQRYHSAAEALQALKAAVFPLQLHNAPPIQPQQSVVPKVPTTPKNISSSTPAPISIPPTVLPETQPPPISLQNPSSQSSPARHESIPRLYISIVIIIFFLGCGIAARILPVNQWLQQFTPHTKQS